MEKRRLEAVGAAVAAFIAVALYFRTLWGGFIVDEFDVIVKNRWITDIKYLPEIFTSSVWAFLGEEFTKELANYYRPVMYVIYMGVYKFSGTAPWGYHLVNTVLHGLNTALVFFLASRLVCFENEREGLFPNRFTVPFFAALLFAVNPVNVESVVWVAAVPELTFTFLCLLSFLLYLFYSGTPGREGERGMKGAVFYLLSIGLYGVALFTKETAVVLPALIGLYGLFSLRISTLVLRLVPYGAVTVIFMAIRAFIVGPLVVTHEMTPVQYALTVVYLFGKYLEALAIPFTWKLYHTFFTVDGLSGLSPLGVVLIMALIATPLLFLLRRSRDSRAAVLGFFWVVLPVLPPLLMLKYILGERVFAERYLYFSSIGFSLLAAMVLKAAAGKEGRARIAVFLAAALTILSWSAATVVKSGEFTSLVRYWTRAVNDAPQSYTTRVNLATAYAFNGMYREAIGEYTAALAIKPAQADTVANMATAYLNLDMTQDAILCFNKALTLSPAGFLERKIHVKLGDIYYKKKLPDETVLHYGRAISLGEEDDHVYNSLGVVYAVKGEKEKAIEAFVRALRLNPGNAGAARNLERLRTEAR